MEYLESMARTALGDSIILVCICQFRLLILFSNWERAILLFRLPKNEQKCTEKRIPDDREFGEISANLPLLAT